MKKLAMVLGVMLLAVSAAAAYLWREAATQRSHNAEAASRIAAGELVQSSGSSPSPAQAAGRDAPGAVAAAVADPASAAPGQVSATAPARGQPAGGANALAEALRQMQNSPEVQEMTRIMSRQMLEQQYPDLAKEMNLSPEKAGKLLDLLARHRMEQGTEMLNVSNGPQDRAAREERARALAKRDQAYQGELSALLGSNYPKWAEYQSKAEERQQAMYTRMGQEQLRDSINASGTPLTDAQFKYLNTALEAEQNRIDRETTSVQQQMQRLPQTNRRLIEVASAHLNPQQLERYRQYLQQQQEMVSVMDFLGDDL
jgi:hypothetical protein